jgi:hypothetical protein
MSTTADVDLQDAWTDVSPPLRRTGARRAVVGVTLPGLGLDPAPGSSAFLADPNAVNAETSVNCEINVSAEAGAGAEVSVSAEAGAGAETVVSAGDVSAKDAADYAEAASAGRMSSTSTAIPVNGARTLGTGGVDIVTLVLQVSIDPSASYRRSRDVTWTCDICKVTVTSRLAGAVESLGEHVYRHHHRGAEPLA